MRPKKLEEYKHFKFAAWTLIIFFAIFVFSLSLKLQSTIKQIEVSNVSLEERLQNLEKEVYNNE